MSNQWRMSVSPLETPTVPRRTLPSMATSAHYRVFGWRNIVVCMGIVFGSIAAFMLFDYFCRINPLAPSTNPYYVEQAWSWLHGHWYIDVPGNKNDVIVLNGRLYLIFGPTPALLLVPFVAIWGIHTSDVFFTLIVSSVNVSLLFLLFEQLRANGLTQRKRVENLLWAVLLYASSAGLYMALGGTAWHTAHVVAVGFLLLSLLFGFRGNVAVSAIALGFGFLSRFTLVLGFPFVVFLAWYSVDSGKSLWLFLQNLGHRKLAWRLIPIWHIIVVAAIAGVFVMAYLWRNSILFGNPLESGYDILNAQQYAPFTKDGTFSSHYILSNIVNSFFNFPRILFPNPYSHTMTIDMLNYWGTGTSVFLTCPLFLLLFVHNRRKSMVRVALWAVVIGLTTFLMFYYTSGFHEFGTRYLFDIYPYAWVLLVLTEARMDVRAIALGVFGSFMNVLGGYQFWTNLPFTL